jgi:PAS domain S-box-containing protein
MAIRRLMQRREQALAEAAVASADLRRVAGGLAERERLIRLITDSMPARLSYWDRDLRCRLANRTLAAAIGRSPEQMIGMRLQEMLPPDRHQVSLKHAKAALSGEPRQFESNALTVNGRRTSAIVYYVPDVAGDEVPGFFAFALDITELKDAREEAQRASAAKSQFLSNMSHEIRTPLNAVLGMLALLRMTALDGRQSDYAAKAEAAARSLLSLLNDVLDFSKIEAGKMTLDPRPFSFRTLLDDLQVILSATVGEKSTRRCPRP